MSFAPPLFTAIIERLAKAHNASVERRMSVQVTGLADIVRQAKTAIDTAGVAAVRLRSSAQAVVNTIGAVDNMTKQLDAANADLQAAVGAMTNGDPNPGPLPDTIVPAPVSPPAVSSIPQAAPVVSDIPTSITAVQNANAVNIAAPGDKFPAPPQTPVVPPPVVTASTIAAANAANAVALAAAQTPST